MRQQLDRENSPMTEPSSYQNEVSLILKAVNAGETGAEARLISFAYDELKNIARAKLRGAAVNESFSPTVLVNEMYMKMFGSGDLPDWSNRGHFFSAVARAMRQILIDKARSKKSQKRGGDRLAVEMELSLLPNLKNATANDIIELNEALESLAEEDQELVELVELKFFVGHTTAEAAESIGIPLRTANRRWQYAKARLWQLMKPDENPQNKSGHGEPK
jgi:RNA polymerase sigma factor (TIGR02999 family)